jgi:hypothetical protein
MAFRASHRPIPPWGIRCGDRQCEGAEVEEITVALQEHSQRATIVGQTPLAEEGPSIEDADVIGAGGLGLG